MAKTGVTVQRLVKVDRVAAIRGFEDELLDEVTELAVRRARHYVPVRTGKLKRSLRRLSRDTVGSTVRYAGYVEDGTRFMAPRHYIKKALRDVQRAMSGLVHDAMRRAFR